MFVDLDWPLNASSLLSASAELLVLKLEAVVTTKAISCAKLQSNSHHQWINQHPTYNRSDALPVAQPTVSKHWRENVHIPCHAVQISKVSNVKNYIQNATTFNNICEHFGSQPYWPASDPPVFFGLFFGVCFLVGDFRLFIMSASDARHITVNVVLVVLRSPSGKFQQLRHG